MPELSKLSETEWAMLSPDEFKSKVIALLDFPQEVCDEVVGVNIRYLNVKFGVIPARMRMESFQGLLKLEEFRGHNLVTGPPLPFIQSSWNGKQVADWLISAGSVQECRRNIISDNLTGNDICKGHLKDIVTYAEMAHAQDRLADKISSVSKKVWDMFHSSPELRPSINQTLLLQIEGLTSEEDVNRILTNRYYDEMKWMHQAEENDFRDIKNEAQPNIRNNRTSGR
jgi:hypothetical protein